MTSPITGVVGRATEAVADLARAGAATAPRTPDASARLAEAAVRALASAAGPLLSRAARALAEMIRGRAAVAGYAASPAAARASASRPTGALAFLQDKTLSIEEKLMRLLAHLSEKWEKEMQAKLDEMAAGEGGKKSSSKGVLGGVAGAFSKALGVTGIGGALAGALKLPGVRAALEKLGGPVLGAAASALGFPAAAPALVRYGGAIFGAAADAASSAAGAAATSEGKGISDAKRQQLTLEIQRLYEKQKEMFGLVSSILRVSHETRSAVIGNIR